MKRLSCFKHPYILFFVLFFVYQAISHAEITPENRLSNILQSRNDTNKVLELLAIVNDYRQNDSDSALFIASQAINVSEKIDYKKGTAESLYQKSVIYKNMEYLDSAIFYSKLSIQIFKKINSLKGIANNYNLQGSLLRRKGDYLSALENHKKSLKIFTKTNDSLGLAKTYNYLGIVYKEIAKYDSSIVCYLHLMRISEKINFSSGYISGLLNSGQVYLNLKETTKAKEYLFKSLDIIKDKNDKQKIGLIYNKLGTAYYTEGITDSALYYYNLALKEYKLINQISGIAHVYVNIGIIHESNEEYNIALEKFLLAKSYFEQIDLQSGVLSVLNNLAVINEKQQKYRKAIIYYDSAIILAQEMGAKNELLTIYNNIHKTYKLLGDNATSLKYLEQYISLKDSIFNLEKTQIISDLELKYEKEKNEAEILALNLENLQKDLDIKKESNRKTIYMATGGLFFLVALFLFLYFRQLIRKNKQLAAQKLLKAEEEKKLSSAQSLVEGQEEERIRISKELHDGVGVLLSTANLYLSTVAGEAIKNKELIAKAQKIVDDANTDVRKISRNLMPTILALHGLDDALQELMNNIDQLPDKYGEFHVAGTPVALSKPREVMVYRLVQELISNTMKHAKAESVDLELNYKEKELVITYKDDGIGFDLNQALLKKSLGLKSIQSRVDYLQGKIDFNNSVERGVEYVISIPISPTHPEV